MSTPAYITQARPDQTKSAGQARPGQAGRPAVTKVIERLAVRGFACNPVSSSNEVNQDVVVAMEK